MRLKQLQLWSSHLIQRSVWAAFPEHSAWTALKSAATGYERKINLAMLFSNDPPAHRIMPVQEYQRSGPQRKPSSPGNVKVELAAASVPHPAVTHRPGQAEAAGWGRPAGEAPEQATMPLQQASAALPPTAQEENRIQPGYTMTPDQRAQLDAIRFQSGNAPAQQQAPPQGQLQ